MTRTFRIRRSDPDSGDQNRYPEYALGVPESMTVLEALLRLQTEPSIRSGADDS